MFDRPAAILARLKAPLALIAAVLGLWLLGQALLYRSGLYYRLAEPDSNTGATINALLLMQRGYEPGARNVLVFGDSRIGEGFSAKLAEAGGGEVNFVNLAVPGSTARTWHYLLREIVREGYDFDAVVVGTLYQPRDAMRLADWPLDPAHQIPLLGLSDLRAYPDGFESDAMRERAHRTLLLPALTMQQDTRAALAAPLQRAHKLLKARPGLLAAIPDYGGRAERMPDLAFDPDGAVLDWSGADPLKRTVVENHLSELHSPSDAAIAASNRAFTARWLGGIAGLAAQRDARVILFQIPRGPYHALQPRHGDDASAPAALAGHANAVVLPAALLDELEQPQFFFDALHLNRAGRERMSAILGERVPPLLPPVDAR